MITWHSGGRSRVFRYRMELIERLAALAMSGYDQSSWGGVEIGGVLFGALDDDRITHVKAYRALACEHEFGPAFELSSRDIEGLERLLAEAKDDRELEGMRAVGWYQSVSSRELFPQPFAELFHAQYFPEPWQIAVFLQRSRREPLRAGFFFRATDGRLSPIGISGFTLDELRAMQTESKKNNDAE